MSTNHRLFGKKQQHMRVHMEEEHAIEQITHTLYEMIENELKRDLVIVCIGTDRSTGDSLGPLIGSKLESRQLNRFSVHGTLEKPVHAVNLEERLAAIQQHYNKPFIVAIDACLGRTTSIGHISIADGPLQPGAAVQKKLPAVGDIHLTGIVNVGGMMEYFVLQNTRLHTVMKMADTIADAITKTDSLLLKQIRTSSILDSLKKATPRVLFSSANKQTPL